MANKKARKSDKTTNAVKTWQQHLQPVTMVFMGLLLSATVGLEASDMLPQGTTMSLGQPVIAILEVSKKISQEDDNS
ncbi:hypothetical protein [Nodularia sp. UHCC 0506]|uniref:hypothetical protein n=1 Tax=Nodularia sp. UHCC 0506 TaxID=3110243 RepID=UPI002B200602|nr:hypothetical protein [Nodularia sp. UHCC 0506]MEA5512552.1 hypothetical protein [Nodularia sp. UHCC 0506]